MCKIIKTKSGHEILIDEEDWGRVKDKNVFVIKPRNIQYAIFRNNGELTYLHRFLVNAPEEMMVDHRDNNGLNNQRYNLRCCTNSQNQHNREKTKRLTSSKFKGVHYATAKRKWLARVTVNRKLMFIGEFYTEIDAARAYNKKAEELIGEYACLNIIP